ncbi:hypothetical protein GQ54DRAFT_297854 [Martensiomyces pterosporus]|nr:hypothetical protein GQ54DRAFT_297854 [Martensiomyces pterosporus]
MDAETSRAPGQDNSSTTTTASPGAIQSCEQPTETARQPAAAAEKHSPPNDEMYPVYLYMGPAIASLAVFSMAGVLVRVYLSKLFAYAGEPVFVLVWPQMIGCFIMGMATRLKGVLASHSPALNLGITTGLCGSITTFSSWQLGIYTELFNTSMSDHSRFKNFLGGMSVLTVTLGASVAALRFGQIVGDELRVCYNAYVTRTTPTGLPLGRVETAKFPDKSSEKRDGWLGWSKWTSADVILVVVAVLGTIATVLAIALARRTRSVSIALLFGPVGTLLRWRLSSLNTNQGSLRRILPTCLLGLPLGTFVANVAGSMALAVIHILQSGVVVHPAAASCQVLAAMVDGFCGCLTTVSTFAVEVTALKSRRSMAYAGVSIVVAQAFFVLIAGIYFKTSTVDYPVC